MKLNKAFMAVAIVASLAGCSSANTHGIANSLVSKGKKINNMRKGFNLKGGKIKLDDVSTSSATIRYTRSF